MCILLVRCSCDTDTGRINLPINQAAECVYYWFAVVVILIVVE